MESFCYCYVYYVYALSLIPKNIYYDYYLLYNINVRL